MTGPSTLCGDPVGCRVRVRVPLVLRRVRPQSDLGPDLRCALRTVVETGVAGVARDASLPLGSSTGHPHLAGRADRRAGAAPGAAVVGVEVVPRALDLGVANGERDQAQEQGVNGDGAVGVGLSACLPPYQDLLDGIQPALDRGLQLSGFFGRRGASSRSPRRSRSRLPRRTAGYPLGTVPGLMVPLPRGFVKCRILLR